MGRPSSSSGSLRMTTGDSSSRCRTTIRNRPPGRRPSNSVTAAMSALSGSSSTRTTSGDTVAMSASAEFTLNTRERPGIGQTEIVRDLGNDDDQIVTGIDHLQEFAGGASDLVVIAGSLDRLSRPAPFLGDVCELLFGRVDLLLLIALLTQWASDDLITDRRDDHDRDHPDDSRSKATATGTPRVPGLARGRDSAVVVGTNGFRAVTGAW